MFPHIPGRPSFQFPTIPVTNSTTYPSTNVEVFFSEGVLPVNFLILGTLACPQTFFERQAGHYFQFPGVKFQKDLVLYDSGIVRSTLSGRWGLRHLGVVLVVKPLEPCWSFLCLLLLPVFDPN